MYYTFPYWPDIHPWSDANNKGTINSSVFIVHFEKSRANLLLPRECCC